MCKRDRAEACGVTNDHHAIRPLISGGKLLEYSAHMVPEGGLAMVPASYTRTRANDTKENIEDRSSLKKKKHDINMKVSNYRMIQIHEYIYYSIYIFNQINLFKILF
ncbi:hypothetical protein KJR58_24195, partial [Escherichia coli]|nr:hypothetical protein [Escherichia coli]